MLTDTSARKAQPKDKDYKLADSGGLYLFVTARGAKIWRMKYRFGQKEKRLIFGPYPEVKLQEARDLRDEARRLLRANKDPGVEQKKVRIDSLASAEMTFERLARSWFEAQKSRWAPVHADDVITSLERDVFPDIGALPCREVGTQEVLIVLRAVERRGAIETARRLRQRVSAIATFGIAEGLIVVDPAPMSIVAALKPLPKKGKQPALIDIKSLQKLLIDVEASEATPVTKCASRLLALTAVRPGVVAGARWEEFEGIDWDSDESEDPIWHIPSARMKLALERKDEQAFDLVVPLAGPAVDVVRTIRRLTGRNEHLFPSQRHSHKPMSLNAIGYLYNRSGYHGRHVPHGWRAAFSTIMNERAERQWHATGHMEAAIDRAIIDLMLAHVPKDKVESAYNRAAYISRRREIAEDWATLLMEGLPPARLLLTASMRKPGKGSGWLDGEKATGMET